jgi:hypothetical protein
MEQKGRKAKVRPSPGDHAAGGTGSHGAGENRVPNIFRDLLIALLIASLILSVSLTFFAARRLWEKSLTLTRFKRIDLEFAGAASLYWRQDKVKITLYLALYVVYTVVGLLTVSLVSLGLLRVLGILR